MVVVKDLQLLAIHGEPDDDPTATIAIAPSTINQSIPQRALQRAVYRIVALPFRATGLASSAGQGVSRELQCSRARHHRPREQGSGACRSHVDFPDC